MLVGNANSPWAVFAAPLKDTKLLKYQIGTGRVSFIDVTVDAGCADNYYWGIAASNLQLYLTPHNCNELQIGNSFDENAGGTGTSIPWTAHSTKGVVRNAMSQKWGSALIANGKLYAASMNAYDRLLVFPIDLLEPAHGRLGRAHVAERQPAAAAARATLLQWRRGGPRVHGLLLQRSIPREFQIRLENQGAAVLEKPQLRGRGGRVLLQESTAVQPARPRRGAAHPRRPAVRARHGARLGGGLHLPDPNPVPVRQSLHGGRQPLLPFPGPAGLRGRLFFQRANRRKVLRGRVAGGSLPLRLQEDHLPIRRARGLRGGGPR